MKYVRFVIAAGLSVPFNVASRVLFSIVLPFEIALILAHMVGMLVAYVLTRTFVFRSSLSRKSEELMRFAIVNIVSLLQTWVVAIALLRLVFPYLSFATYPELCAHVIGLSTASVTSFFGHRMFSFQERPELQTNEEV